MGALAVISSQALCPSGCRTPYVRSGHFYREDDRQIIQRYSCKGCGGSFSDATSSLCYRQKKRSMNQMIFHLLTGCYSQRRAALDLALNRKTVIRKFVFLGLFAKAILPQINRLRPLSLEIEFDELETAEHTKCKPISVIMAAETKTRWILSYGVASMPAKGKLAAISRAKYGKRKDERPIKRRELFDELKALLDPRVIIKSDQNPAYANEVKIAFPQATHKLFKGKRSRSAGQGELKKGFDPIFTINHSLAMLRANINRLIRRTWCTTKRQDRLDLHIALYVLRHNLVLIQHKVH